MVNSSHLNFNWLDKKYEFIVCKEKDTLLLQSGSSTFRVQWDKDISKVAAAILKQIPALDSENLNEQEQTLFIKQLAALGNPLESRQQMITLAETQQKDNVSRQRQILGLLSNQYYLFESAATGRNPLDGYVFEPSYYMTSDQNAFLKLAKYEAANANPALAAEFYTKALQLTGFIGKLPEISEIAQFFKSSYKELTLRIPVKEIAFINKKISQLDQVDDAIRLLIGKINHLDYKSLFWPKAPSDRGLGDALPYYALEGVRKGNISKDQFTTLMRVWSLYNEGISEEKMQILPLSHLETQSYVEDTMEILRWQSSDFVHRDDTCPPFLNSEQFVQMINEMQSAFPSEQCVIIIDDLKYQELTISQFISYQGFNVLARPLKLKDKRMIPSATLEKAFLKKRYKKPCLPNYVLGSSTLADIRLNGIQSTRDVATPFPKLPLPKQADGRSAPSEIDFIHHDFFHCYSSSEVGDAAKLFIELADHLSTFPMYKTLDAQAKSLRAAFIDLDLPGYRHHVKNILGWKNDVNIDPETIFWHAIAHSAVEPKEMSSNQVELLKECTRFLLKKKGEEGKKHLFKAADHVRRSLNQQGKEALPENYQWIFTKHPIFVMEQEARL